MNPIPFLRTLLLATRLIYGALLINGVVALVCAMLPLFSLLDYESGVVLALAHGFTTLLVTARATARGVERGEDPMELWLRSMALSLLLLAPTFLIMVISAAVEGQCAWGEGFTFFLFYPVFTAVFSGALGFSVGRHFSKKAVLFLAPLLPLLSILIELIRFYALPAIFSYDPWFGYFSGALYDRLVEITPAFVFARGYHLLFALGLSVTVMGLKGDLRTDPVHRRLGFAALALAALMWFLAPQMGFRFSRGDLKDRLGGELRTKHYIINYSTKIPPDYLKLVAAQAEFHYGQLDTFFKGAPADKITIWLFASPFEKRTLFGAENVEVAKPWLNEIYVTAGAFPHRSLKHELAHIFAGIYGDSLFKVSFSTVKFLGFIPIPWPDPGLIEGAAVAASFDRDGTTYHERAKILYMFKLAAPMEVIFSSRFYTLPASRAYTQAGSFMRYLYDTYGARALFRLYARGGGFHSVYNKSLRQLDREYQKFMEGVTVDAHTVTMTRALFARRPLHKARCAHQVAREIRRAENHVAARNFSDALFTLERAMGYDPASLDLKMFYLLVASEAKAFSAAEATACTIRDSAKENPLMQARSQLVLSKMEFLRGDLVKAHDYLKKVEQYPLSRGMHREVAFLKAVMALPEPTRGTMKHLLYEETDYTKAQSALARLAESFPMSTYIAGTMALTRYRFKEAVTLFAGVDPKKLLDDEFRCAFYHRAAKAAALAREPQVLTRYENALRACPKGSVRADFYKGFSDFIQATPALPIWRKDMPLPKKK